MKQAGQRQYSTLPGSSVSTRDKPFQKPSTTRYASLRKVTRLQNTDENADMELVLKMRLPPKKHLLNYYSTDITHYCKDSSRQIIHYTVHHYTSDVKQTHQ